MAAAAAVPPGAKVAAVVTSRVEVTDRAKAREATAVKRVRTAAVSGKC